MKTVKLVVFLFWCLPSLIHAQQITYFNEYWKTCSKDSASYYRIAEKKGMVWVVNDYYITNELQMSGTYKDDSLKIKDGVFTYYTKDGQKRSTGSYKNNNRVGFWQGWYETGEKSYEGSADSGVWNYWYKSGKLEGVGLVVNDKPEGIWKWYYESGVLRGEETYKADNPIKVKYYDEKGKRLKHITRYEQVPAFKGGSEKMMVFIAKHVRYPKKEREDAIEGRVVVQFIVNEEGFVVNPVIIKSVTPAMDNEVLRVVSMMPQWQPGYQHGKPVKVKLTLPVSFRLQ